MPVRSVNSPRQRDWHSKASVDSQGPFEGGFVGLAVRSRHSSDQIGDSLAEGELRAIGILKSKLAVPDDPGTVQRPASDPSGRSKRPKGINDRRGAIWVDVVNDQRRASVGIPGRIAPSTEETPVGLRDRRGVGDPVDNVLITKDAIRLRLAGRWLLRQGRRRPKRQKREQEWKRKKHGGRALERLRQGSASTPKRTEPPPCPPAPAS